jgi:S-formylglutathione hydrolase FrmB
MRTTVHARIILPASWFSNPSKTYPSLYLLSGSSADNQDWRDWMGSSPIESFMQNRDVLTVMPEDGNAGWYSNWLNSSLQFPGRPQWETFHTVELPQLLARGYRANGVNAIGGVSEASVGVINYSAGHPGLFKAAAAFSGMMNTEDSGSIATVQASELRALDTPGGPWGDPVLNRSVWDVHNPMHNIAGLASNGVKVWICAGNGNPGPGDTGGFKLDSYVYEQAALSQNKAFLTAAQKAGVSVRADFYGAGDHDWPAWIRAFPDAWSSTLAPALGVPA